MFAGWKRTDVGPCHDAISWFILSFSASRSSTSIPSTAVAVPACLSTPSSRSPPTVFANDDTSLRNLMF